MKVGKDQPESLTGDGVCDGEGSSSPDHGELSVVSTVPFLTPSKQRYSLGRASSYFFTGTRSTGKKKQDPKLFSQDLRLQTHLEKSQKQHHFDQEQEQVQEQNQKRCQKNAQRPAPAATTTITTASNILNPFSPDGFSVSDSDGTSPNISTLSDPTDLTASSFVLKTTLKQRIKNLPKLAAPPEAVATTAASPSIRARLGVTPTSLRELSQGLKTMNNGNRRLSREQVANRRLSQGRDPGVNRRLPIPCAALPDSKNVRKMQPAAPAQRKDQTSTPNQDKGSPTKPVGVRPNGAASAISPPATASTHPTTLASLPKYATGGSHGGRTGDDAKSTSTTMSSSSPTLMDMDNVFDGLCNNEDTMSGSSPKSDISQLSPEDMAKNFGERPVERDSVSVAGFHFSVRTADAFSPSVKPTETSDEEDDRNSNSNNRNTCSNAITNVHSAPFERRSSLLAAQGNSTKLKDALDSEVFTPRLDDTNSVCFSSSIDYSPLRSARAKRSRSPLPSPRRVVNPHSFDAPARNTRSAKRRLRHSLGYVGELYGSQDQGSSAKRKLCHTNAAPQSRGERSSDNQRHSEQSSATRRLLDKNLPPQSSLESIYETGRGGASDCEQDGLNEKTVKNDTSLESPKGPNQVQGIFDSPESVPRKINAIAERNGSSTPPVGVLPRGILSSSKKYIGSGFSKRERRSVVFGSPKAAEYRIGSPSVSMTPMPSGRAKTLFSMLAEETNDSTETESSIRGVSLSENEPTVAMEINLDMMISQVKSAFQSPHSLEQKIDSSSSASLSPNTIPYRKPFQALKEPVQTAEPHAVCQHSVVNSDDISFSAIQEKSGMSLDSRSTEMSTLTSSNPNNPEEPTSGQSKSGVDSFETPRQEDSKLEADEKALVDDCNEPDSKATNSNLSVSIIGRESPLGVLELSPMSQNSSVHNESNSVELDMGITEVINFTSKAHLGQTGNQSNNQLHKGKLYVNDGVHENSCAVHTLSEMDTSSDIYFVELSLSGSDEDDRGSQIKSGLPSPYPPDVVLEKNSCQPDRDIGGLFKDNTTESPHDNTSMGVLHESRRVNSSLDNTAELSKGQNCPTILEMHHSMGQMEATGQAAKESFTKEFDVSAGQSTGAETSEVITLDQLTLKIEEVAMAGRAFIGSNVPLVDSNFDAFIQFGEELCEAGCSIFIDSFCDLLATQCQDFERKLNSEEIELFTLNFGQEQLRNMLILQENVRTKARDKHDDEVEIDILLVALTATAQSEWELWSSNAFATHYQLGSDLLSKMHNDLTALERGARLGEMVLHRVRRAISYTEQLSRTQESIEHIAVHQSLNKDVEVLLSHVENLRTALNLILKEVASLVDALDHVGQLLSSRAKYALCKPCVQRNHKKWAMTNGLTRVRPHVLKKEKFSFLCTSETGTELSISFDVSKPGEMVSLVCLESGLKQVKNHLSVAEQFESLLMRSLIGCKTHSAKNCQLLVGEYLQRTEWLLTRCYVIMNEITSLARRYRIEVVCIPCIDSGGNAVGPLSMSIEFGRHPARLRAVFLIDVSYPSSPLDVRFHAYEESFDLLQIHRALSKNQPGFGSLTRACEVIAASF